jgi:hypothetical protein
MNTALITVGKRLLGDNLFLVSVFDLEPSGVIIKAYNQTDSREYSLPISEREVIVAVCFCVLFSCVFVQNLIPLFVCVYFLAPSRGL